MIRSTKELPKKKVSGRNYPYLGINRFNESYNIVLFIEENTGISLERYWNDRAWSHQQYEIYDDYRESSFEIYDEPITIKNTYSK